MTAVKKLEINYGRNVQNDYFSVGYERFDQTLVSITEHRAQGEGDCWSWVLQWSDGTTERIIRGDTAVFYIAYEDDRAPQVNHGG